MILSWSIGQGVRIRQQMHTLGVRRLQLFVHRPDPSFSGLISYGKIFASSPELTGFREWILPGQEGPLWIVADDLILYDRRVYIPDASPLLR